MAPANFANSSLLDARAYVCNNGQYSRYGRCYNKWDYYGRWILLAVLVFVVVFFAFIYSCIKSRRRRRHGQRPMYGTGWMAPPPNGQGYNNPAGYSNPPPAYGAPSGQSYPMDAQQPPSAGGYYGQSEGVQQPKNVYNQQPGHDYAPPPGPPPPHTRP